MMLICFIILFWNIPCELEGKVFSREHIWMILLMPRHDQGSEWFSKKFLPEFFLSKNHFNLGFRTGFGCKWFMVIFLFLNSVPRDEEFNSWGRIGFLDDSCTVIESLGGTHYYSIRKANNFKITALSSFLLRSLESLLSHCFLVFGFFFSFPSSLPPSFLSFLPLRISYS